MPNDAIRAVVTDKGRQLAAKLITTHAALQLTAAKVGDGDMPIGVLPTGMTDLAHYVMDATMADLGNPANGEVMVALQIMPADVQSAFFAKEAALYALDPDIGQIAYAYIPMQSDPTKLHPIEDGVGKILLLDVSIPISNIAEVTAVLSPSAMVSLEQLGQALSGHDADAAAHAELLLKKADLVDGKVPAAQLPVMDYIPNAQKGVPNGVATLTADGILPVSQVPKEAKEIRIVGTVAERNAITDKFSGLSVYVKDATADATVKSGGAYYLWDGTVWIKTGEAESMDVVTKWPDIAEKPSTFPPGTHTHTPAQAGVGKTLTFTGAATGTYDGTGDVSIKIPEGGGCVLQITFESVFSGKAFTVTGAGESYTGTVPASLTVDVTVKNVDTEYTVSCDGVSAKVTTGPYFGQYPVSVRLASLILNENTWAQIRKVSDAGTGANYWKVGDTKTITINGQVGNTNFSNLSIDVFIIGFNHNAAREGANRIHFQIGKINGKDVALVDSKYGATVSETGYFSMNSTESNAGGWSSCQMRTTVLGSNGTPASPPANTLLGAFPPDLRAVMKPCTKYSDNTGGGSNTADRVTGTMDYLFPLAGFECYGLRGYENSAEKNYQAQYDYYKAGNSKLKYRHDSTGTLARAFCRSARADDSFAFCVFGTDGHSYYTYANNSSGIAPGFCV